MNNDVGTNEKKITEEAQRPECRDTCITLMFNPHPDTLHWFMTDCIMWSIWIIYLVVSFISVYGRHEVPTVRDVPKTMSVLGQKKFAVNLNDLKLSIT